MSNKYEQQVEKCYQCMWIVTNPYRSAYIADFVNYWSPNKDMPEILEKDGCVACDDFVATDACRTR